MVTVQRRGHGNNSHNCNVFRYVSCHMIHHCVFRNVTKTSALLSTAMEDTVLANFTLWTKGNWYDSLNLSPMFFSSLATDAMITSVFGLLRESGSSLKSSFELLSWGFSLFSLTVFVLSILNSCKKNYETSNFILYFWFGLNNFR